MIHVAVAVVLDRRTDQVLLARRQKHQHLAGLWEFPGGKLERGESAEQALVRELREEVGLQALSSTGLVVIEHDYGDLAVTLHVRLVDDFSGQAQGQEGQQLQWVALKSLADYPMPEANLPIVQKLFEVMERSQA